MIKRLFISLLLIMSFIVIAEDKLGEGSSCEHTQDPNCTCNELAAANDDTLKKDLDSDAGTGVTTPSGQDE